MIVTLRETTKKNAEQGWLDSNLARIGGLLQGQRDLGEVCRMIMTEVTPLVDAQLGAFFLADDDEAASAAAAGRLVRLRRPRPRRHVRARRGAGRAGRGLPPDHPGRRRPDRRPAAAVRPARRPRRVDLVVLPVLFEGELLGVIEFASVAAFSELHLAFLDRLVATIGVALNTILANRRTEELLAQSQRLAQRAAGAVGRAAAHQRRAGGEGGAAVASRSATSRRRTARSSWPGSAWRRRRSSWPGLRSTSRSSWPT